MDNTFNDKDTLLAKWLSGELKGDDLKSFEDSQDFQQYKKIADATATLKVPAVDVKEKLTQQKKYNQSLSSSKKTKTIKLAPWLWSAAAAIAIVFVTISFLNSTITISTDLAQTETHILPDGSEVELNADSSITYDKDNFLESRLLELDGEAYFKVQKGSTFTVKSSTGNVQVLGTAFNVYDRNSTYKVHCDEGKVRVSAGASKVILEKDMAAFAKATTPLTLAQNKDINPTWREGKSTFKEATLKDVIEEIERQYDVSIESKSIDLSRKYTGFFTYKDLDKALYQICTPMNIVYSVQGKTIRLSN